MIDESSSSGSAGSTRFTSVMAARATAVVVSGRSPVSVTTSGSTLAILPRTSVPSSVITVTSVPAGMFSMASAREHEGASVSATTQLNANDAKRVFDMHSPPAASKSKACAVFRVPVFVARWNWPGSIW